ncbi:MAG: hypothetical protein IJW43_04975 [Clostridia bacterium]|nr:hypothetical protein [Clostridia bacterium]
MSESKNMLTTKELTLLKDLLLLEEAVCKKARLYSTITMNVKLKGELENLSKKHEQRFLYLFSLL